MSDQDKITGLARRPTAPIGVNFGLRMAECIAQCSNLEDELHHTASKLCILGFEPLKESLIHCQH